MRLLFRHTLRSVLTRPLKSAIVIFVLIIAAIMTACSYETLSALGKEESARTKSTFDNADIVVELQSGSSKVIAEKYLAPYLEEGDVISGYYILPFYNEEKNAVWGAATDFYDIDEIFDITFTAFSEIKASQLGTSILISSGYAEKYGADIGDSLTLTFLDEQLTFTVCGISEYLYFGKYDLIVHMPAVINVLTSKIGYLAVFDENDFLYSSAYIRLADASRTQEVAAKLSGQAYGNFSYSIKEELDSTGFDTSMLYLVFFVMAFLVFVIATFLVYNCFNVILSDRKKQHDAFALAGVPSGKLIAAFGGELFCYVILATAVGCALSAWITDMMNGALEFTYMSMKFTWGGVVAALLCELMTGAVVVAITTRSFKDGAKRIYRKYSFRLCAVYFAIVVSGMAALFFIPVRYYCFDAIIVAVSVIACAATFVPAFLSIGFPRMIKGKDFGQNGATAYYAIKNLSSVREIKNVCSTLCIVVTAIVGLTVCLGYGYKQYDVSNTFFNCDYIVSNVSAEDTEEIKNIQGIDAVTPFYFINVLLEGKNMTFVSIEDPTFVSDEIEIEELPQGDKLIMSETVAELYGYEEGERVTFNVNGKESEFEVVYNYANLGYIAFFDSDYVDTGTASLLIRADGGKSKEIKDKLLAVTQGKAIYVDEVRSILEKNRQRASLFITAMSLFFCLNLASAVIGISEVVAASYNKRKDEFYAYSMCGMDRSGVKALKAAEIGLSLVVTAVAALIPSAVVTIMIDASMRSFGYSLLGYSLF